MPEYDDSLWKYIREKHPTPPDFSKHPPQLPTQRNLHFKEITEENKIDLNELDDKTLRAISNGKSFYNFLSGYDRQYIKNKLNPDKPNPLANPEPFYPSIELLDEINAAAETSGGKRIKYRKTRANYKRIKSRKPRRKPRRKTRRHN